MDDKFLYELRPTVRPAFAIALRRRLASRYPEPRSAAVAAPRLVWRLAVVALLAVTASMFMLSGEVRAMAWDWIKTVAGFNVEERSESPMKAVEEGAIQPTVYSLPTVPVSQALENAPFAVGLPTWVPEGFTTDGEAVIANSKQWVMLKWSSSLGGEITLVVEQEYTGYSIPTGEDSGEEIVINGDPALLVRGAWDGQYQWDTELGLAVYWIKDGHDYRLIYAEREPEHNELTRISGGADGIKEQLIRMAETIR